MLRYQRDKDSSLAKDRVRLSHLFMLISNRHSTAGIDFLPQVYHLRQALLGAYLEESESDQALSPELSSIHHVQIDYVKYKHSKPSENFYSTSLMICKLCPWMKQAMVTFASFTLIVEFVVI